MSGHHVLQERFDYTADPIKGSRFVAVLVPALTEVEAAAALEGIRKEFKDASHHCWATRWSDGTERSHDDGEPRGSAGRPILAQLEGHDTAGLLAVVIRWFGGTKLGVGGLIRAYGGTAGKALDRAPLAFVEATSDLRIDHAYDDTNPVASVLAGVEHTVLDTGWGATVTLTIRVKAQDAEAVRAALIERTAGRARVRSTEEPLRHP